jgi:hypothetical protein
LLAGAPRKNAPPCQNSLTKKAPFEKVQKAAKNRIAELQVRQVRGLADQTGRSAKSFAAV